MQGTIAQTLGLAMHGNAFLRGRDPGAFWPEATFFKFCRSVRFVAAADDERGTRELPIAADPWEWLRSLPGQCRGLRTIVLARNQSGYDVMTVGLAGGGSRWLIEEMRGASRRVWTDEWSVTDPEATDRRIWSVTYRSFPLPQSAPSGPSADLDRSEIELLDALKAIAGFARRIGSGYSDRFQRALDCLRGEETCLPPYYPDLAPAGLLSPRAQRILTACEIGWVFGGMGSWNDGAYGGQDTEEGDTLSGKLFNGLQATLAAVANSTDPSVSTGLSPSPTAPSDR